MSSGSQWLRPVDEDVDVEGATRQEGGDLAARVTTGVGAAGEGGAGRLAGQLLYRPFQLPWIVGALF